MSLHDTSQYERTTSEENAVGALLEEYFDGEHGADELGADEKEKIRSIIDYVDDYFAGAKYVLGLGLDFVLLAQQVSDDVGRDFEPKLTVDEIFNRHKRITERGGKTLNTLTLRGPGGAAHGIRKAEERILGLFHDELNRLDYPSAYVYNTGQWQKYQDMLVLSFQLSLPGRYVAVEHLIDYGLAHMSRAETFEGNPRVRLLQLIVNDYPRGEVEGENAGVIFQGIVYGYIKADRPHLSLIVDKVRTGSKRQKRIGDIDCYLDVKVEMSVEVKDFRVTEDHFQKELGTFVQDVLEGGIHGVVIARDVDEKVLQRLEGQSIVVRTQEDLLRDTSFWDWPKQDAAVRGLFHYLAHVEQNHDAVDRLQWFVHEFDPDHDVLQGFNPDETEPPAYQGELELE